MHRSTWLSSGRRGVKRALRACAVASTVAALLGAAPYVPSHVEVDAPTFMEVGLLTARIGDNTADVPSLVDAQLIGLSLAWRGPRFGVFQEFGLTPRPTNFLEVRGLTAVGARVFFQALGVEWSVGTGASVEARLDDHFWLAHLRLFEAGVTLHERRSMRLRFYGGVRYNVAGALINSYLIDPNGFHSSAAQEALDGVRDHAFSPFFTLAFVRAL